MTGRDVLAQVREALTTPSVTRSVYASREAALRGDPPLRTSKAPVDTWRQEALAALDGCVLLTREEAAAIAGTILWLENSIGTILAGHPHRGIPELYAEAKARLALLTPEEPS